jgi:uncharacterized Zn-binding protein involved in type VI secretion
MPGVVRVGLDSHVGHLSPTPNPFHRTSYASGSSNVITNGAKTVRIGDTTSCGDPAVAGSPNVFVNGIAVHRLGDGTGGHGSWVANAAATGSSNVIANGAGSAPDISGPITTVTSNSTVGCDNYDWNNAVCLD